MSTILKQADEIVNGDRARAYGHPFLNHSCTAELWTSFLKRKYGIAFEFTADDVCWLNILQKVSREANLEKFDNLLDVIGYSVNIDMIHEEQKLRAELAKTGP